MFKRVFNRNVFKQFLIIALITALVACAVDLFVFGNINTLFPKPSVYAHFNKIATQIIKEKNVDFLENSGTLDYFTVFTDSQNSTHTISLYGDYGEKLTLVVSNDYNLISMERLHDSGFTIFKMIIGSLFRYLFIGISAGLIGSIIVSVVKFIYAHITTFFKNKFGGFLEKLFEDEEDDDDYYDDDDDDDDKKRKKNKDNKKNKENKQNKKKKENTPKPKAPANPDDEDFYDDFDIEAFEI